MNPTASTDRVDAATARVLGLPAYLDRLDPVSEPGRRRLQRLPSYGPDESDARRRAVDRLETVESWMDDHPDRVGDLRDDLRHVPSLETPLQKLEGDATLSDADLFELKQFGFYGSRALEAAGDLPARLDAPSDGSDRLRALVARIHPDGRETPRFHLSGELDADLAERLDAERDVEAELQRARRETAEGIVDELGGSRGMQGRYLPPDRIEASTLQSRSDLERRSGGWFVQSARISDLEAELETRREQVASAEQRVRRELTDELAPLRPSVAELADFLAGLDVQLAKVRLKDELEGCWGRWREGEPRVEMRDGRDPNIAELVAGQGGDVQPIDLELRSSATVVTGPNMGGKSALLRLLGLCQWATHHACPVPARAFASRPVVSVVYVGSEEPDAVDAERGLSSFGREVRRLVDAIEGSVPPVLWLLDEVGRGTHPEDGAELARRLLDRLSDRGDTAVAATHFPALADDCSVDTLRIRGLEEADDLDAALADAEGLEGVESALRSAMDFQPERVDAGEVPRDARRVADALGLALDE